MILRIHIPPDLKEIRISFDSDDIARELIGIVSTLIGHGIVTVPPPRTSPPGLATAEKKTFKKSSRIYSTCIQR
jgi:hypothetical protein